MIISKKLISALNGNVNDIPPIWMMRQAGRFLPEYRELRKNTGSFLDLCYTPEASSEATLQPIRRFGFDGAIIFSDILVIPDALGVKVEYLKGEGPCLEITDTIEKVESLDTGNIKKHLSPVFEALGIVKGELPSNSALIGFAGAPWTVATYMVEGRSSREFGNIKKLSYSDSELFGKLIDILTKVTSEYLLCQIEAGAEVIQLFDSWAGVLPENEYKKWVIEPAKNITENIKSKYPDIPVIGFPKGSGVLYEEFVKNTGVDGVSIDFTVPLKWASEKLQKHVCVQGNLDNVLLASDKEGAVKETRNIIDILGKKPFIFNLGHGVLPFTPIENVQAVIDEVRS